MQPVLPTKDQNIKKYSNMKVYITGYGPFMNVTRNPSQVLVETILKNKDSIHFNLGDTCQIIHNQIFEVSVDHVCKNVSNSHSIIQDEIDIGNYKDFHLIVHFGVNEGADAINLETQCENFIHDYVKHSGKISDEGDNFLQCKLDINSICSELSSCGHKIKVSNDAGTYLCNYVYYKSQEKFQNNDNVASIFIHIPKNNIANTEDCEKCFVDFLKVVRNKYISN